jgi:hypothetical protein
VIVPDAEPRCGSVCESAAMAMTRHVVGRPSGKKRTGILLGFAPLMPADIREGIRRLAGALR